MTMPTHQHWAHKKGCELTITSGLGHQNWHKSVTVNGACHHATFELRSQLSLREKKLTVVVTINSQTNTSQYAHSFADHQTYPKKT